MWNWTTASATGSRTGLTWVFESAPSPAEGVIARKLFPLQLIICASPEYLVRHGAPDGLDALSAHRCSAFRSPGTGRLVPWRVKMAGEVVEHPVVPALCVNDEATGNRRCAGRACDRPADRHRVRAACPLRAPGPIADRTRRRTRRAPSSTTAAGRPSRFGCAPSSTLQ